MYSFINVFQKQPVTGKRCSSSWADRVWCAGRKASCYVLMSRRDRPGGPPEQLAVRFFSTAFDIRCMSYLGLSLHLYLAGFTLESTGYIRARSFVALCLCFICIGDML